MELQRGFRPAHRHQPEQMELAAKNLRHAQIGLPAGGALKYLSEAAAVNQGRINGVKAGAETVKARLNSRTNF